MSLAPIGCAQFRGGWHDANVNSSFAIAGFEIGLPEIGRLHVVRFMIRISAGPFGGEAEVADGIAYADVLDGGGEQLGVVGDSASFNVGSDGIAENASE